MFDQRIIEKTVNQDDQLSEKK